MNFIDNFSIKNNLSLYRNLQSIINPKIVSNNKYIDLKLQGVNVRVFDPAKSSKIIIYIHGGGWVAGNLNTHSNICYKLAVELKRKVISIDYRLAPEYPYPNGLNDCYKVIKYIMNNINLFGINWEDVVLMGDSAGGNLAFAVSLKALYEKKFRVGKLILIYPAVQTDYSKETKFASVIKNDGKSFLTRKHLEDYINMYLPDPNMFNDKFVNVLRAHKLFGLPKTMIITGELDPLHDEGVALVKKLKRHLVSVKHYDLQNACHGYLTNILDKKNTKLTIELIKGFIGDKFE